MYVKKNIKKTKVRNRNINMYCYKELTLLKTKGPRI